jgi:putative flippase GtrA
VVERAVAPVGPPGSRLLRRHPLRVQLAHYVVVGGLATAVNAAVFLLLRTGLDTVPANLVALLVSTAVSTEANHRFTFGGAVHRWRARVQVGGTVAFYAFYSSAVLLLLEALFEDPSPVQESLAVAVASVLAGIARFLLLRYWVFGSDGSDEPEVAGATGPAPGGR